jgi:hypothetical protein
VSEVLDKSSTLTPQPLFKGNEHETTRKVPAQRLIGVGGSGAQEPLALVRLTLGFGRTLGASPS